MKYDAPPAPAAWRSLYPFQSHYLTLDGCKYHYLDEGAGEPLLFVHGNPTWSFYWRDLICALRTRYRVIAVDHVGCGLSDKPADYPYCLRQHADNLARLTDALALDQATLLAHDWGGPIGLHVVLRDPDRFARLVLFNTAAFRSRWAPWRIRACRAPLAGRLAVQGLNAFSRAALWMATEKRERFTAAVRSGYLAPYDSWTHRTAVYRFVEDIPLSARHPSYATLAEVEDGLPRLAKHPALLVWGFRDWCFVPKFLRQFQAVWPQAEVREVADAGHYVVEDAHERIVPWLREFLDRHPAAQGTEQVR